MKRITKLMLATAALSFGFISCNNKEDVPLPTIDGYNNSNEVAAASLKAHWTFDGTQNEAISATAPAQAVGASYVTGIKGQGIGLANGFLYYTGVTGLTSVTTSFTVSAWVQVQNNAGLTTGGTPSEVFQYVKASPTVNDAFGNINFTLETGNFRNTPAAGYDTLIIHPTFRDPAGGLQDNINNFPLQLVKDTAGKWIHTLITYDATTHLFNIWANNVKVGNFPDRGTNVYTPAATTKAVIGAWIANVTGSGVNPQGFTVPFVGSIDEVRVYNKALTDAEIGSLYKIERAGR